MIATREQLFFLIFFSLCMKGGVFASSENLLSDLSNMGSVSWTEAIADPSEDGSKIAYYSQNPTAEPFFYPRLVSVFEFMDAGNTKFFTLKQLSKNPKLVPRPKFHNQNHAEI